ncbi:MAG: hypothetical protein AAFX87_31100 [Bacteroidota bacterium]
MICPAYQSAFIYDKEELNKRFSYFQDSLPKENLTASVQKDRFLIIEPQSFKKKNRSLQTIEMKDVMPIPDTTNIEEEIIFIDSIMGDTVRGRANTWLKGPYNVEQETYMYIFRDILVLPDRRAEEEAAEESDILDVEAPEEKKGFFSFLKRKKKKEPQESLIGDEDPPTDEEDEEGVEGPPKKKGLFNRGDKKKKPKQKKPKKQKKKPDDEADPEDDEEDADEEDGDDDF